jgi:peptidoglycan/xylan/chitin deacetylase (PgdA/CDA1 family)
MNSINRPFARIIREIKYAGRDAAAVLGTNARFFKQARGARILLYHGICLRDHTRFNPIFLTRDMFERHLQLYKKYFNVVSLEEFYSGSFSNTRFNVCITFDDGYANNYKYVVPLLEKYELPATFFITAIREAGYYILWNDFLGIVTRYGPPTLTYDKIEYRKDKLGRYASAEDGVTLVEHLKENGFEKKKRMMELLKDRFPFKREDEDYWKQMDENEIRSLSGCRFVTIGSHGYFHNRMDNLQIGEAVEELKQSRRYLENLTGKKIDAFAFPYGNYSRILVEEAKNAGYTKLLAMDFHYPEDEHDPALRERFTVNPFISPNNQMYATITRSYP